MFGLGFLEILILSSVFFVMALGAVVAVVLYLNFKNK